MRIIIGLTVAIFVSLGILFSIFVHQRRAEIHSGLKALVEKTSGRSHGYATTGDGFSATPSPKFPEGRLAQLVRIKTSDGELTIPAGTLVRILNEKSPTGTIMINYQGYSLAVPSGAVASMSQ